MNSDSPKPPGGPANWKDVEDAGEAAKQAATNPYVEALKNLNDKKSLEFNKKFEPQII